MGQDATPAPPLTLTLLGPEDPLFDNWLTEEVRRFETIEPSIRIELQTLERYDKHLSNRLAENPPDLFVVDSLAFPDLVAEGLLAMPADDLAETDSISPLLLRAFEAGGRRFCLPREVRTLALVYDADALTAQGLTPPRTWEELFVAAEALTSLNRSAFGLILSPDLSRWMPLLLQAGARPFPEGEPTALNSSETLLALETFIDLFRRNLAGYAAESNSAWAGEVLGKGYGGMAIEGNWVVPYFESEFPDFNYGIAPLPSGPGGAATLAFTSCYGISSTTQHADAALALANHLSGAAAASRAPLVPGRMPVRLSDRQRWSETFPSLRPFADGLSQAHVWQLPAGHSLILRGFNRRMIALFNADIESIDLLRELQQTSESIQSR